MTALAKARLAEITATDNPTEVPKTSVPVQFNPTSLRVQIGVTPMVSVAVGVCVFGKAEPGTGHATFVGSLISSTASPGLNPSTVARMPHVPATSKLW